MQSTGQNFNYFCTVHSISIVIVSECWYIHVCCASHELIIIHVHWNGYLTIIASYYWSWH